MNEHPSHNFSDSLYFCYGCGCRGGDLKLAAEECPTPDAVGRGHMIYAVSKINETLRKEFGT